jgi:hypothetical protein
MSEKSQLQGASVRRRRAGHKSWATRAARAANLKAAALAFAEVGNLPATIIERTVERITKPDFLRNNPGTPEREVIPFWQAEFETSTTVSSDELVRRLDAGDEVATRKAVYKLHSRTEREGTEAERRRINHDNLSKIMTARMRCR